MTSARYPRTQSATAWEHAMTASGAGKFNSDACTPLASLIRPCKCCTTAPTPAKRHTARTTPPPWCRWAISARCVRSHRHICHAPDRSPRLPVHAIELDGKPASFTIVINGPSSRKSTEISYPKGRRCFASPMTIRQIPVHSGRALFTTWTQVRNRVPSANGVQVSSDAASLLAVYLPR